MNQFPDFSQYEYQIEKELGSNRAGGRVTYLGIHLKTQEQVVIKQFQFARKGASWSEYDAYEREIQLLKDLNHPGIPRYLDSFHTADGFCMVQEYKHALSLASSRSFAPHEVQQIAIAALEILVYLQNRIPPIIHRDIKPENILVDDQMNVYLVDFGFARIGDGEVGVSSVVKGTLGFMPPEQLFNRQLTEASDLYGLGITLICLLTGTKSIEIGNLIDITYRINFKHLVPKLSIGWVSWLEKMTEPKLKERFPNAAAALKALPSYSMRLPEPIATRSTISVTATRPGERLIESITLRNPIPDTTLEGTWEVATHPSDPPPSSRRHAWIEIQPQTFTGNQVECQVVMDTAGLRMNQVYNRTLLLHTNALPKTTSFNLQIRTAPLPVKLKQPPYLLLTLLFGFAFILAWLTAWVLLVLGTVSNDLALMGFSAIVGAAIGLEAVASMMSVAEASVGAGTNLIAGILAGGFALLLVESRPEAVSTTSLVFGAGIGFISAAICGCAMGITAEKLLAKRISSPPLAILIALLISLSGISLGLLAALPASGWLLLTLTIGSNLALLTAIGYSCMHQLKQIARYKRTEQHLIKP